MKKEYHVFVSHSWSHSEDLRHLRGLLNKKGNFNVEFEEVSSEEPINSYNSGYIKHRLKQKIEKSDIVLALAGLYASYSDWMVWELDTATTLGIPIVGIIPRGQERVSKIVSTRSKENVRWNSDSIVNAIKRWV